MFPRCCSLYVTAFRSESCKRSFRCELATVRHGRCFILDVLCFSVELFAEFRAEDGSRRPTPSEKSYLSSACVEAGPSSSLCLVSFKAFPPSVARNKMWCQEKLSVFAALIFIRMGTCLKQVDNTRLTCFSSVHPTAPGIHRVYDEHNDAENLYERKTNSLPHCSSCFSSSSSECCACINGETVYVLCSNLTDDMKLIMEIFSDNIPFFKTDCPTPPPADRSTPPPAENQREQLGAAATSYIVIIPLLIFVIIIIGCVLYYRRSQPVKRTEDLQQVPRRARIKFSSLLCLKPDCVCETGSV